jgi:glycosyltransferase involved in cell wall biosynthesis
MAEKGTGMNATIVIPCYNEEKRLPVQEFARFMQQHNGVRLLFVNDGSKDNTLAVLRKLAAGSRHQVLDLQPNGGKAEAVRKGMLAAMEVEGTEVVGFWDADLATPLPAILDLLGVLEARPKLQWIFGARVKLLGRAIRRKPARHYLGRVFATAASMVLQLPVYDTQCGAKLFRVTPELREVLGERLQSKWIFDVELISRFLRLPSVRKEDPEELIYEYPLHAWEDVAGSKLRPKDFLKAAMDLIYIWRNR